MRVRFLHLIAVSIVLSLGLRSGIAAAHPLVEDGTGAIERASFAEAIELFDRAADGDDLRVGDLVQLLEGRALAVRALRGDATDDLRRLAAIRPDHRFARHVPPELVEAFHAIDQERLGVHLETSALDGRIRIHATPTGDPGGLVRAVQVAVKAHEGWLEAEDEIEIDLAELSLVAVHIRVIALGGAVVIEQGSREEPWPLWVDLRLAQRSDSSSTFTSASTSSSTAASALAPDSRPAVDETAIWIVGLTGLGAAAALTTALVLVTSEEPSSETALAPPRFVMMEFDGP